MGLSRNIAVVAGSLGISTTLVTATNLNFADHAVKEIGRQTVENVRLDQMTDFWQRYSSVSDLPITIIDNGFEKCFVVETENGTSCIRITDEQALTHQERQE